MRNGTVRPSTTTSSGSPTRLPAAASSDGATNIASASNQPLPGDAGLSAAGASPRVAGRPTSAGVTRNARRKSTPVMRSATPASPAVTTSRSTTGLATAIAPASTGSANRRP